MDFGRVEGHAGLSSEILSPFFIMGCRRSGTTLVSQFLNAHSGISVFHETHYYPIFFSELPYYGDLRRPNNLRRLVSDVCHIIQVPGEKPLIAQEILETLPTPTFQDVLSTMLHLHARQHGKLRGGDKTPDHYRYLPEFLGKFPDSSVIFLVRDPRDTVHSIRKMWNTSVEGACYSWNQALAAYLDASRPLLLVKYEELVAQPACVATTICSWLEEEYEPRMLEFYKHIPQRFRALQGVNRLVGPVNTGSIGNFRNMPDEEIEQIERFCADGMKAMGYSFTTSPSSSVAITAPKNPSSVKSLFDRVRYYGTNRERWRRGWARWRILLRLRIHYFITLGPFRREH